MIDMKKTYSAPKIEDIRIIGTEILAGSNGLQWRPNEGMPPEGTPPIDVGEDTDPDFDKDNIGAKDNNSSWTTEW